MGGGVPKKYGKGARCPENPKLGPSVTGRGPPKGKKYFPHSTHSVHSTDAGIHSFIHSFIIIIIVVIQGH